MPKKPPRLAISKAAPSKRKFAPGKKVVRRAPKKTAGRGSEPRLKKPTIGDKNRVSKVPGGVTTKRAPKPSGATRFKGKPLNSKRGR